MSERNSSALNEELVRGVLDVVSGLCQRYQITSLKEFLESCHLFAEEQMLSVALLGRFKAGKSSFLNHLLGRDVLPVGVIPVTTVVTEIEYGPNELASVRFVDGPTEKVSLDQVREFVSEANNPENRKAVERVLIKTPLLERYRGIRFVDTPGLESALAHNTTSSRQWLPNAGLALVAVAADTPLSQHDIELLRALRRYTPNISILLTKVDLLDESGRREVEEFLQKQLARQLDTSIRVFPYSVRPGFDNLRRELHNTLLSQVDSVASAEREAILRHKLDSLLKECAEYLILTLKAAEVASSEREALRERLLGRREALDDQRLALRLIIRHGAASTRTVFEDVVRADEQPVRERLLTGLEKEFPSWTRSLRMLTERFEEWLRAAIAPEMIQLSDRHRPEFLSPLHHVNRQLSHSLQDFRNRLSEHVLEALGVPLRTTDIAPTISEPSSPDIRVGKIFNHNWELLSFMIPVSLIKGTVKRHFQQKVRDVVFMNLSRLVSQWEEVVNASLRDIEKDSVCRLEALTETIQQLTTAAKDDAPRIRADLQSIEETRARIR